MENYLNDIESAPLYVCLYSDANFLSINILENLLSQKCFVNVVSSDLLEWESMTKHVASKNRFNISERVSIKSNLNYNYVIYCGGFIKKELAYEGFKKLQHTDRLVGIKTIAIMPYEAFDLTSNSTLSINTNMAVVYVGDILGPRIDLNSNLLMAQLFNEALLRRSMTLAVGEMFYPLFVTDIVRQINKWLFSFGPYGRELFLLGTSVSATSYWQENAKIVSDLKLKYRNILTPRVLPRGYEVISISGNLKSCLVETYKWFGSNAVTPQKIQNRVVSEKHHKQIVKTKKIYPKYLKPLLGTITMILLFPFLSLILSSAFFMSSYQDVISGRSINTEKKIFFAKTFAVLSKEESRVLSAIPLIGRVYREAFFAGEIGEKSSDIALTIAPLLQSTGNIFNNVLGDLIYNPTNDAENVKVGLDYLYRSTLDMEAVSRDEALRGSILAKKVLNNVNFDKIKKLTLEGQKLATNLPNLLGVDKRKAYLILFQNNMELRPTGGFIGSYGIMTFDGGRMSDLTVNDIYSADGQLNGHVEPPTPIKDYLGEANWWFRDSNWDPDFPTSAKRAEWFLDKEVGKQVDGVISTDLYPIKEILKSTGPVFLADYNLSIDEGNIYERTQSEVQDDFFPGTRKKGSFLTALSRNLLSEVSKTNEGKKILILKSIFKSFEERHLQAYIHDSELQKSIGELMWDGGVSLPTCGESCSADFVGLVEANVGVNKANYFITRNISLDITFSGTQINKSLTLNIKNSASPALGPSGRYKTYLRLLVPSDSELISALEVSHGTHESLQTEITEAKGRREIGVLVEVLGGSSKTVRFDWKSAEVGKNTDSYGMYFRKQAGVGDDPLKVSFRGVSGQISSNPLFSLTKDGVYSYNTTLSRDFFSRFSWNTK